MNNSNIQQVQIVNPCTQHWDGMLATPGGKYCGSCQKNVVDFSQFSNQQIIDHLSKNENTCGRFADLQLDNLNYYLSLGNKRPSIIKKWSFVAAMLGWLPFASLSAQVRQGKPHQHNTVGTGGVAPNAVKHRRARKRKAKYIKLVATKVKWPDITAMANTDTPNLAPLKVDSIPPADLKNPTIGTLGGVIYPVKIEKAAQESNWAWYKMWFK